MITPANHPTSCVVCGGSGVMEGPSIPGQHHGRAFTYTTVVPCTHHWANDDPDPTLFSRDECQARR